MKETALEKANRNNKANRDAGVTVSREYNLIKKAKENPKSLKAAIGGFCFNCFGGTSDSMPDPGWQQAIRECTDFDCPLYPHRPYRRQLLQTKEPIEVWDIPKGVKFRQMKLPTIGH